MSNPFFDRPILNSPYERPSKHWELDADGQPTQKIIEERRREIAERRRASVNTVGNQLAAIYGKLGVSSRHELVARLSRAAHETS